jgi:putative ABC transport system permease protein
MSWRTQFARLRSLLAGRTPEDLSDEIHSHLLIEAQENLDAGMSPDEAHYAALRRFGNVTLVEERSRAMWGWTSFERVGQDVRYGLRQLRRAPSFAVVAVLTLALGIGAVAVIFSVVDNALLHPFPYRDADGISVFHIHNLDEAGDSGRLVLSVPEYLDYQEQNHVFSDMTGTTTADVLYTGGEGTKELSGAYVTTNTFQFLGVPPVVGRWIAPDDGKPDAPAVFLMNYRMWQEQFHGDRSIIGRAFTLNSVSRQLIGIMPPRFQYFGADVYLPISLSRIGVYSAGWVSPPGRPVYPISEQRRKPGVSLEAVAADLNVIAHHLARQYPSDYPKHFNIQAVGLASDVVGNFKTMLYILLAAVGMLLLIACSNVANLLLARATSRQKEIAIRASIGAGRGRLVRQLLVESGILAALGGATGLLFAYWGLQGVVAAMPQNVLPSEAVVTMNWAVLAFTVATTVVTTLLCGLAPALHAVRRDLQAQLQDAARGTNGGYRHSGLRSGLVVAEVALSIVLLAGASLMMRSFFAVENVNPGFDPHHVLVERLVFPTARANAADQKIFFQQLLPRIAALPGVVSAAEGMTLPPFFGPATEVTVPNRTHSERWLSMYELCSEGWFRTVGVPLERGRLLSETDIDSARMVAVINQTFGRKFLGTGDPIGQKVKFNDLDMAAAGTTGAATGGYFEVVGVVGDSKNMGLREAVAPEAFLPYTVAGAGRRALLVRTTGDPLAMARTVNRVVWRLEPGIALQQTRSIETFMRDYAFAQPRFSLIVLGAFAGIGLILVITGVFSVLAYSVSLQTHQIGIRMALGAQRDAVLGMILGRGMKLLGAGIVLGEIASLLVTNLLSSEIWGVSARDPLTLGGIAAIVVLAGVIACLLPARKASRVDPMVALRYE